MTTFEHALLGINGALAFGLHRRYGWSIVAVSGFAAIAPDWDGLPMMIDMARFESGHRVWGHNLLACLLLGALLGTLDWRFRFSDRMVSWLGSLSTPRESKRTPLDSASEMQVAARSCHASWWVWMLVASVAALSQIPADLVVSGGKGLSDWPLKPLWPFAQSEWVYPMIPWGNLGVTIIFGVAMIAQAKWSRWVQPIAIGSLLLMATYLIVWKFVIA